MDRDCFDSLAPVPISISSDRLSYDESSPEAYGTLVATIDSLVGGERERGREGTDLSIDIVHSIFIE